MNLYEINDSYYIHFINKKVQENNHVFIPNSCKHSLSGTL